MSATLLIRSICAELLVVSIQSSILIAIIWAIERILKPLSPLVRYWLWMIVLVRLCVPFGITMPEAVSRFLPVDNIGIVNKFKSIGLFNPSPETIIVNIREKSPEAAAVTGPVSREVTVARNNTHRYFNIAAWLGTGIAVLLIALVMIRMVLLFRRLSRGGAVVRADVTSLLAESCRGLGISRRVDLVDIDDGILDVPATIGFITPRIFIPRSILDSWTAKDIEPIILHELAHVRRRDIMLNSIQLIVQAVYFFNPLVWYANKRIREHREEVCDDVVVAHYEGNRTAYSKSLLRVMERVTHYPAMVFIGIAFSERKSAVSRRITRLLSPGYRPITRVTIFSAICIAGIALVGVSLSSSPAQNRSGWVMKRFHDGQGRLRLALDLIESTSVADASEMVRLNGVKLKRGHDYIIDCDNGLITFTQPVTFDSGTDISIIYYTTLGERREAFRSPDRNDGRFAGFRFNPNKKRLPFVFTVAAAETAITPGSERIAIDSKPQRRRTYTIDYANHRVMFYTFRARSSQSDIGISFLDGTGRKQTGTLSPERTSFECNKRFQPKDDHLRITLADNGTFYVNGRKNHEQDIASLVKKTLEKRSEAILEITCNRIISSRKLDRLLAMIEHMEDETPEVPAVDDEIEPAMIAFQLPTTVKPGSEEVFAGDTKLVRDKDYTIDYSSYEIHLAAGLESQQIHTIRVKYQEANDPHNIAVNFFGVNATSPHTTDSDRIRIPVSARIEKEDGTSIFIVDPPRTPDIDEANQSQTTDILPETTVTAEE